jgi:hypothetical protein
MNSKSLREQSSAGAIVFLMMALVFIPIIAVHAVMAWQDQLAMAPQQLAAIVNFALSAF